MSKYKYNKENTELLNFHMQSVHPDYMFGHAIIAGKLANREFQTYEEYTKACSVQGIAYFSEQSFNKFMELNTPTNSGENL